MHGKKKKRILAKFGAGKKIQVYLGWLVGKSN
jgi:hypothetical protein